MWFTGLTIFIWTTLISSLISFSSSYEILGVCTAAMRSHWSSCESVFRALSDANHNVTVISMLESNFPPRSNHEILYLDGLHSTYLSYYPEHFSDIESGGETISILFDVGPKTFDLMMRHQRMQKFLKEGRNFDLIIVESFASEAFYGLGEHFNAHLIGLSTTMTTGWLNYAVGNTEPWSYIPNQFLHAHPEMSFNDRFNNVLLNLFEFYSITQRLIPQLDQLMKKHLPGNRKSLQQVMQTDICMGFVNDHFTLSLPRPNPPNMIAIGGIHLNAEPTERELTGEFKAFMDSASDGVIVFSLGSILKASEWSTKDRETFIKVFAKLKQKVIWRYDLPDADQLPKNILGRKWIPQQEILAHHNAKIFITHGGMLGTTEAVYNGVSLLGIPFFGDQHVNVARAEHRGYAVKLNRKQITEESLTEALQELLNNPKYIRNAKIYAEAYKDQPMTPQETVVFWTEFAIRHNCAPFMKVTAHARLGVVEFYNLDVWSCLAIMIACAISLIMVMMRVVVGAMMHFRDKLKQE